jgi:DNA modification methylase
MKIIQGDCREKLKELPDESVDCIVTSPPYWGLRDYGVKGQLGLENKITDYVNNLADIFDECKRVLKKTGTAWLNIGDSYATNGIYIGTYLKKNPQHKDLHTDNSTRYPQKLKGYRNKEENIKAKDLCLIPFRVVLELQQRGWYVRSDIIWAKPNPMPESIKDRPTKSHEYIFLLSKSKNYHYDADAIKEDCTGKDERKWSDTYKNVGSIIQGNTNAKIKRTKRYSKENNFKRNKRDVWTITTKPYKGAHFATFPKDLIEPCIKAGCPEKVCVKCGKPQLKELYRDEKTKEVHRNVRKGNRDRAIGGVYDKWAKENPYQTRTKPGCDCNKDFKLGVVLDPFAGSGTVGEVALELQKDFILIELNPEYIKLIEDRLHKLL